MRDLIAEAVDLIVAITKADNEPGRLVQEVVAISGLADGAAWPIKNAIRKFRAEFEEYIKKTNPKGYGETRAVPALATSGAH